MTASGDPGLGASAATGASPASGAERVYSVSVVLPASDQTNITEWLNRIPGARVPGPFPLPKPNRLQVGSGFPRDIEQPILGFDKPKPADGRLLEAYQLAFLWIANEQLTQLLRRLDPSGFDAVLAQTRFPSGEAGPDYWMLDLVRYVDGYDVDRSVLANPEIMSNGVVNFAFDGSFFRASAIANAPFFRIPQSLDCLCSAATKQAIEAAGHAGLAFFEVGWAV